MKEHLVNLNDGVVVDPEGVLIGAWRGFALRRIAAGDSDALEADGVEHFVYVLSGSGTLVYQSRQSSPSAAAARITASCSRASGSIRT